MWISCSDDKLIEVWGHIFTALHTLTHTHACTHAGRHVRSLASSRPACFYSVFSISSFVLKAIDCELGDQSKDI